MKFFLKSKSENTPIHPLTYKPGGVQLTFLYQDGTYQSSHQKIKYPKQYTEAVVNKYINTNNPVVKVFHQNGVIYEKNKS